MILTGNDGFYSSFYHQNVTLSIGLQIAWFEKSIILIARAVDIRFCMDSLLLDDNQPNMSQFCESDISEALTYELLNSVSRE